MFCTPQVLCQKMIKLMWLFVSENEDIGLSCFKVTLSVTTTSTWTKISGFMDLASGLPLLKLLSKTCLSPP